MTLIIPVGNNSFGWAPKANGLTKTASTGEAEKSDKDLLFDAAQKFVKAQAEKEEKADKPEEKADKPEEKADKSEEKADKPCDDKPCDDKPEASVDVQKAVQELVEKSQKAEEVAQKVSDAVSKVEEAVQEVKDAAGVAGDSLPTGSLPEDAAPTGEVEEVELEIEAEPSDVANEAPVGTGDELIKESLPELGVVASANDFVKLSEISPETRKKVTTYWQDYLGFPSDYVKLMVKNYEK